MNEIPNFLDDCEPTAVITQHGRWVYGVHITHGLMGIGPDGGDWLRLGRRQAERKGHRELARYKRAEERRKSAWTIT